MKERAAKVATIAAVEVEYSLWALDIEKNGVLSTCINLDIPVVAYSPLGRLVSEFCEWQADSLLQRLPHWEHQVSRRFTGR
jgi:aryl-alcohol dehydrogenase-like predicted oxidoreductase